MNRDMDKQDMQPMPSHHDVNKILETYFLKKGYSQSELAYIQESADHNIVSLEQLTKKFTTSPTLPNHVQFIKREAEQGGGDLDATMHSYQSLREWIFNALDLYKHELQSVLYPMFVHVFLDLMSKGLVDQGLDLFDKYKHDHIQHHTTDIESLAQIQCTDDMKENAIATLYLNNKYNIRMSSIPFELFISYLQDKKFLNLIRIVNQHLNIHLVTGKLSPVTSENEGIAGHINDQIEEFHEINHVNNNADTNKVKQEVLVDTMNMEEIAAISYRGTDIQAELESLSDLRKRVSLGSAALPSVCIYTFHNTHDLLNCLTISQDTTLVAGGFSESYIKVWSLKGNKLTSAAEKAQGLPGTQYKKMIGHAGPVYGVSFSHDNQYLISCSEDQTVRLWSLDTFTNLVCYKSHNYPIWDVDFGPYGFYFATASHDKTARLWSCDHVNPLRIFAGHLSDVNAVRFHPNSKYVVTASSDRTARLWDVQRGTCVRVFTGHTGSVHTVAVSPNGRLMASAGEDKTIIVWDLGTGKRLKTMTGHTGFIYSVSFNLESTVLVSGSADGTVRVWDVIKDTPLDVQETLDSKRSKQHGKQKDKKDNEKMKPSMDYKRKKGTLESNDHLSVFPTKNTPIYTVQFTQRNLCLAAGASCPPSLD
ncbi:WD40-repeat-containing domain protein [Mucor mucedo]|uniref:WD40-repeat-containing domain protein n=1 Tax=Mucor mucedo TaxID=29922 RepID=UPI00222017A9|nr:WD40-repeat-containing domain protein [Mucor mucedo]KAI7889043.1 WD40-repeat-containing domain protein [Mucor mucedo]